MLIGVTGHRNSRFTLLFEEDVRAVGERREKLLGRIEEASRSLDPCDAVRKVLEHSSPIQIHTDVANTSYYT